MSSKKHDVRVSLTLGVAPEFELGVFCVFLRPVWHVAGLAPFIAVVAQPDLEQIRMIEYFRQCVRSAATTEFVGEDVRGVDCGEQ